jgi:hypothetical protein
MVQYSLQYFQLWGKGEIRQRECLEIILPKAHVEERLSLLCVTAYIGGQPTGLSLI